MSWKTACGWPFARNKAEAAFSYVHNFARKKCRKCILNKSKRDGVSEVDIGRCWRSCAERHASSIRI